MSSTGIELRPRFRFYSPIARPAFVEKIKDALVNNKSKVKGVTLEHHLIFKIPKEQRTYWSPQMDVDLEDKEEGTFVRCLIGPAPNVWTKFVFIYSGLGVMGLLGSMMGFSQMMLKKTPWGLWVCLLAALIATAVWLIGQTGKRLAKEQMVMLRSFLEEAIEHEIVEEEL
ncbi:hypothetical protein R9C00_17410 [Flammeovirgaceae bacterium SG7u.111]|nr:hypothetical protein [Flammeovirgaceae bacterium SG7u.132]WPO33481.1 hypothetical protein R9C00_17410 [Flammeovirgaceae bacterium SG7u.111]